MTDHIRAAVYDPPRTDLPYLAVVFRPDGDVFVATPVPSVDAGEAFLTAATQAFLKDNPGVALWQG